MIEHSLSILRTKIIPRDSSLTGIVIPPILGFVMPPILNLYQSCSLPIVCTNDITKDETIKKFFVCYDTPFDPLADFSGKHFVIVGSINFHTSASSECPLICTLTRLCKTVASISKCA